jgi:HEAT repeat protein
VLLLGQKRGAGLDEILVDVVRNDPDAEVREAAVMWLAHSSDPGALAALEQILRTSTDREMQQRALMALSQTHTGERVATLLRDYAARTDVPTDLRRHAVMALSQRHDAGTAEFLRSLYGQLTDEELREQLIFAVAQTRDARNGEWLLDIATRESENAEVRKRALFFAAQQPQVPVDRIAALYDSTRDRELKEQVLFALSQRIREPAVVEKLMEIGRNETDPELRNRAVFWLSQSRDPRVPGFLLEIIKR